MFREYLEFPRVSKLVVKWVISRLTQIRGLRTTFRIYLLHCLRVQAGFKDTPYALLTRHPWDPLTLGGVLDGPGRREPPRCWRPMPMLPAK